MISPEFVFRQGTVSDTEQLKNLGLLSYGQYFPLLSPEAKDKLQKGVSNKGLYEELLVKSQCFVCEDKGLIVGMAFLVPSGNPWDIFPAEWSYIRMVGVDPAYGGKGIAKKLTSQCIDFAQQSGEKIVALHTSEMMDAARHIYEGFGFKILREIEPRFGKRYWLYTLDL
jgi:ribosomal protein S18 acetylase RimI-like enzyme